jgi:hypothetical protein
MPFTLPFGCCSDACVCCVVWGVQRAWHLSPQKLDAWHLSPRSLPPHARNFEEIKSLQFFFPAHETPAHKKETNLVAPRQAANLAHCCRGQRVQRPLAPISHPAALAQAAGRHATVRCMPYGRMPSERERERERKGERESPARALLVDARAPNMMIDTAKCGKLDSPRSAAKICWCSSPWLLSYAPFPGNSA